MNKTKKIVIAAGLLILVSVFTARQAIQVLKDGAQAYLFGYSLVLMDATRQSITNSDDGRLPINHFAHSQSFPDHNFRKVVRPNNDTLYSTAWIDLSGEPLVLSVPDTDGRYYVMPFMDAWTNVFASVGKRTTGTGPGSYLVVGPDWQGKVPENTKLIRSPTNMNWLIGRIQTNTKKDFKNVAKLQRQFTLTPLSRWESGVANKGYFIREKGDTVPTDSPAARVERMAAGTFYSELSRLMGEQPPAEADSPILETLSEFGIEPGKPFDIEKIGFYRRLLLEKAMTISRKELAKTAERDRSTENNWAVIREGIGVYGVGYNVRAFVSMIGLGALPPEEAAYPLCRKDKDGQPLSGKYRYRIHFEAGKTPPVHAFWSLTVYNMDSFLIDNPINRYAIGDRDPLEYNEDGSLDILIQHEQPAQNISNWIPTPSGAFDINLRLYMPKSDFLEGKWKLPPVERIK
ncbi:MAG: DUF1254 domain-containing protein [Deltaproteobacteria bacterium]|nr:DUF1254 domain-containing protein [Deltaproteobacteria bacterium]